MTEVQQVLLIDGSIRKLLTVKPDPLTGRIIYIIEGNYSGPRDKDYGYVRDYYGEGTSFVYPSEIKEYVYE